MPSNAGTTRLVIVESPAKAKTISGYLGPGYVVEASFGHVRDLPRNAADVPAKYKGEPWARLGVDVDNGFHALYVVSADRKQQISKLVKLAKEVDEIFLATDEDREGEAIAWHLVETLKPKVPVKRMVFHEITKPAIQAAVANPREIDRDLVDAQEARRILDRLYGYEVSPVLWKKVMPKLSAGRVQSVATRIVVERERQRMAFRTAEYWDILATLAVAKPGEGPRTFNATLVALDGDRIATGKDFEPTTGQVRPGAGVVHLDEGGARGLAARLDDRPFTVTRVEEKPYRRRPYAPFITSTLQQEAARKLRFSSQQTMRTAQRLYENGYITYMRTDSVNLSETGHRRRPPADRRAVRRAQRAAGAAPLHRQGEERAGGARGDPPGRRQLPHPRRGGQGAVRRGVQALRADLAAHHRLADDRRGRLQRLGAHPRGLRRQRGGRLRRHRQDHHRPGLPAGVRRVQRRRERRGRGRRAAAAARWSRTSR